MLIFSRHASAVITKHLSADDSGQGACSLCITWEQKNLFLIVSCVARWEWQSLAHKSAAVIPVFTSTPLCQSNFLFSLRNGLYGRACRVSVPWCYEKWWSWQDDNVVIIKYDVCIRPQRLYVLAFRQESFFLQRKFVLGLEMCVTWTWLRIYAIGQQVLEWEWCSLWLWLGWADTVKMTKLTCYFVAGPLL